MNSGGRGIPHSREAERAVLGGLMLDPERFGLVTEHVTEEDFYGEAHQKLYALMAVMNERGEPTEMVAVVESITRGNNADEYGGIAYVSALPDDVPSTENIEYYAKIIQERSTERKLLSGIQDIAEQVHGGQKELSELLELAESTIFQVTQERNSADWQGMSTVVDQEVLRIQQLTQNSGEVTGISTGLIDLDRILAGLHRSDLIILAARPAMGKTALCLNIAKNVAMQGYGVGVFSLEMSAGQLVTRLLVSQARVHAGNVRTGMLSKERDWPRLTQAAEDLYRIPLFVDDSPGTNITQIRSKARRLKSRHPELSLIIVDYIGLMSGDSRVSRQEQVSASSRGLKALAKELDVCVIGLSQLNRAVESRNPKIPQMSDLRESGAIEQDADVIMFIYRDEYYNQENTTKPGVAEIIIAKQRNGATGSVELAFQGEYTLFDNLARGGDVGGYV
jgi:replicative DNA helicase